MAWMMDHTYSIKWPIVVIWIAQKQEVIIILIILMVLQKNWLKNMINAVLILKMVNTATQIVRL